MLCCLFKQVIKILKNMPINLTSMGNRKNRKHVWWIYIQTACWSIIARWSNCILYILYTIYHCRIVGSMQRSLELISFAFCCVDYRDVSFSSRNCCHNNCYYMVTIHPGRFVVIGGFQQLFCVSRNRIFCAAYSVRYVGLCFVVSPFERTQSNHFS